MTTTKSNPAEGSNSAKINEITRLQYDGSESWEVRRAKIENLRKELGLTTMVGDKVCGICSHNFSETKRESILYNLGGMVVGCKGNSSHKAYVVKEILPNNKLLIEEVSA